MRLISKFALLRVGCQIAWVTLAFALGASVATAQGQPAASPGGSVEQLTAMLQAIDPYCPGASVSRPVTVFGSTSMDALAHGWAGGFKNFHPESQVEVLAAGTDKLAELFQRHPAGIAMVSRPVLGAELEQLRKAGLKQPVAFMVAREALGVFVHESNPVSSISGEQLRQVFTTGGQPGALKWSLLGATGEWANRPIDIIARTENSGTQRFLSDYVFNGASIRPGISEHVSNAEVLRTVSRDPQAIAICGYRSAGSSVKPLPLAFGTELIPCDDHSVLSGHYPLTRPMSLVIDLGQTGPQATASQELVRYALCQAGQTQAILVGLFPVDLPLLRAGLETLNAVPAH